jgi:hypothetical protein
MFSAIKQALTARTVARRAQQVQVQQVLLALVRQAQAAATVRQLVLVQELAQPWLPAPARQVLALAVQQQVVQLQAGPTARLAPGEAPGRRRDGKTSTSKRRRAR